MSLIQALSRNSQQASDSVELPSGLYLITDTTLCDKSCEEIISAALKAGVKWIQYREKNRSRKALYKEALSIREITAAYGARLIINDHADIAVAVGADGLHLGQDDLPLKEARKTAGDMLIGVSTHSLHEAFAAEQAGADYIGFGPIFHTLTKDAGAPVGLEALRDIKKNIRIPVVAIGGISLVNLESVLETGAEAVAVVSAILKGDVYENAKNFIKHMR